MNVQQAVISRYARIAGASYVLFTLAGLAKNFFLDTRLVEVSGDRGALVFVNETQFRLGIVAEIVMFLAVVMASVGYYVVQSHLSQRLALLALCHRLCEVIVGSVAVVASMVMLAVSVKSNIVQVFDAEQLRMLALVFSAVRMPAYELSWIFMGVAGLVTFYLFYGARWIPRVWSIWGLVTYASLIVYPMAKISVPDLPKGFMVIMYPGALFELGVGFWLLFRGVNLGAAEKAVAEGSS